MTRSRWARSSRADEARIRRYETISARWFVERWPGFWSQVQQGYANRICTSLPSSLRIA